jgi:ribosome-binding factor A
MAFNRIDRIKEEIKRELASIIRELKDPRVRDKMVSVVAVDVTKDLKYAKVHVSVMGTDEEKDGVIKALKSAAGFIRREISGRIDIRVTPEFNFVLDKSIDYGMHINELIHQINSGDR